MIDSKYWFPCQLSQYAPDRLATTINADAVHRGLAVGGGSSCLTFVMAHGTQQDTCFNTLHAILVQLKCSRTRSSVFEVALCPTSK